MSTSEKGPVAIFGDVEVDINQETDFTGPEIAKAVRTYERSVQYVRDFDQDQDPSNWLPPGIDLYLFDRNIVNLGLKLEEEGDPHHRFFPHNTSPESPEKKRLHGIMIAEAISRVATNQVEPFHVGPSLFKHAQDTLTLVQERAESNTGSQANMDEGYQAIAA